MAALLKTLARWATVGSLALFAHAQAAAQALTLGLIAPTSVEGTLAGWQPVADALARELQVPVKLLASKNYAEISAALLDGRVQVAWLNNRLAIEAVESEQAQVFAQMVRLDGHSGYKSLLLAPKDGAIASVSDVLAKPGAWRLGMGDRKSTSGFLVPSYYIFSKNKIDPAKHFTSITTGSHRDNFLAAAEGKVDVAVNNSEDLALFRAEMPEKFAKVRVVWESPVIPGDPLLFRKDLPAATQQKLRKVVLAFGRTEPEKASLRAIKMLSGFKHSTNHQLRPVVDLELFEALTQSMAARHGPKEFTARMEQLTRRAARLDALLSATRLD
jgi:phosphonate transport system substrate-binding protein